LKSFSYFTNNSIFFLSLIQSLNQSEDYDILGHEAHRIIDELVNQSLAHVNDVAATSEADNEQRDRFIELENEAKRQGQTSVRWPSIAEFTGEKMGLKKINEYIENVITFKNLISFMKSNRNFPLIIIRNCIYLIF
jgi:hypothetical protein